MTKFNLAALAAISIAFSVVPLALAHETGTPHSEGLVKKTAQTVAGSRVKKPIAKKRLAKATTPHKMTPGMKM
ncbi:MAG TPA: hypothetical protein V6C86_12845 [Oculatellaceae cyanobacterium]